jgi:hypothetical protein
MQYLKNAIFQCHDADRTRLLSYMTRQDTCETTLSSESQIRIHRYHTRYINATKWSCILIIGYIFSRLLCCAGLPDDAVWHSYLGHSLCILHILLMGIVQALFCELLEKRMDRIFSLQRWWWFLLFFGFTAAFVSVGTIDGMKASLDTDSNTAAENHTFVKVISILGAVVFLIISWHCWYGARVLSNRIDYILGYLFPRFVVILLVAAAILISRFDDEPPGIHFHHYFIGWVLSFFATFDHPISLAFLAVTTAIFVQGIAAYTAAPIIYRPGDPVGPGF